MWDRKGNRLGAQKESEMEPRGRNEVTRERRSHNRGRIINVFAAYGGFRFQSAMRFVAGLLLTFPRIRQMPSDARESDSLRNGTERNK
ncbi:hypothetical protein ZHAS_00016162 [Anopheles sinensis]|uniref:Uncharacterized protein n=1 Tax=Anopheles sinensis TaxID=74873 RepID=A0A084WCN0_ANOSI|nr:hypothetical protein ZHAS_00016162 [Anopheles sinensis]